MPELSMLKYWPYTSVDIKNIKINDMIWMQQCTYCKYSEDIGVNSYVWSRKYAEISRKK